MTMIQATFDGKQIVLPEGVTPSVGPLYVVFGQDDGDWDTNEPAYQRLIQESLAKVWDNPDDDIYNDL